MPETFLQSINRERESERAYESKYSLNPQRVRLLQVLVDNVSVSTLDIEPDSSVPLGSHRSAGRRAHHGLQAGKTKRRRCTEV